MLYIFSFLYRVIVKHYKKRLTKFLSLYSEIKIALNIRNFTTCNKQFFSFSFLQGDCETLLKKIDEVRLLESRKSARLINSDTDFSKLADLNISQSNVTAEARKAISKAIEVPQHRSDYVQISG